MAKTIIGKALEKIIGVAEDKSLNLSVPELKEIINLLETLIAYCDSHIPEEVYPHNILDTIDKANKLSNKYLN